MTLLVYSVRSNARRGARRAGVDPESVVAESGGYVIGALRVMVPAGKHAQLRARLESGWQALPDLCAAIGWQEHSVRGVISRFGKLPGLTVERKREAGVLSYRVVRS